MTEPVDAITMIGIAGSHGVAVARAVVVDTTRAAHAPRVLGADEVEAEWRRFGEAVARVRAGQRRMLALIPEGRPEAAILEAYALMVGDELLAEGVREQICAARRCADWAVAVTIRALVRQLEAVDDPYMRERSHDLEFVGDQLLRALAGAAAAAPAFAGSEPSIVVARDLSPADTVAMADSQVRGFVTERGSRTSHTSIMARALEIPAVVGVSEATSRIDTGDLVIVDGLRGVVVVNPTAEQLEDAHRRAARHHALTEKLGENRDRLASTADGTRVHLFANIELPEEAPLAIAHGAEGVGLYRTEFLYVDRQAPPTEDEQVQSFRRVVERMGDRPVTLRTFDLGGDKFTTTFKLPDELNPMLGLRAVRLQLTEPAVLLAHLRAMVRASGFGNVRVMVPLVCTLEELRAVRGLLEQAMAQVRRRGEPMADRIPLGAMIEVPAAVAMADRFAREADFLSIGTNDLIQYAMAIDRGNRSLAYLASPYNPPILRLVAEVLRAGAAADCPVSVCGAMASEPYGALVLIGLGMRELSMESVALPAIKEALARVSLGELEGIAREALAASTAAEVEELLADVLEQRLDDLLTGQHPHSAPSGARTPSGARGGRRGGDRT